MLGMLLQAFCLCRPSCTIHAVQIAKTGFVYFRSNDPARNDSSQIDPSLWTSYTLLGVFRQSDGKEIPTQVFVLLILFMKPKPSQGCGANCNAWQTSATVHYWNGTLLQNWLHIVDYDSDGLYRVVYQYANVSQCNNLSLSQFIFIQICSRYVWRSLLQHDTRQMRVQSVHVLRRLERRLLHHACHPRSRCLPRQPAAAAARPNRQHPVGQQRKCREHTCVNHPL